MLNLSQSHEPWLPECLNFTRQVTLGFVSFSSWSKVKRFKKQAMSSEGLVHE